jgi:hypothetical protein
MVKVRFECGCEDRMGEDLGPFEYVQATYDALTASPDGSIILAEYSGGWWVTQDGQRWSDFVVFKGD